MEKEISHKVRILQNTFYTIQREKEIHNNEDLAKDNIKVDQKEFDTEMNDIEETEGYNEESLNMDNNYPLQVEDLEEAPSPV